MISKYPQINDFIRKLVGSQESINDIEKYCLWFKGLSLSNPIFKINEIKEKIEKITKTLKL